MINACLIGVMLAVLVALVLAYIRLKTLEKTVKTAWMRLDERLKDRAEYISPVALRAAAIPHIDRPFVYHLQSLKDQSLQTAALPRRAAYETEITQKFKTVFSAARKYPQLQQDEKFLKLQAAVTRAQMRLKRAKIRYNSAVQNYNTLTTTIPLNWLAQAFEFPKHEYFSIEK